MISFKLLLNKAYKLISPIIIITFLIIEPSPAISIQETNFQIDKLSNKISNDFANKFCNGIGFGLSKESAFKFALNENTQIFQKRKEIKEIDQNDLANMIAKKSIEDCGFRINLIGQEGIDEFRSYYISLINK